ncbi:hypothetical protein CBL_14287 [Carabus blaptoides fortunei]
MEEGRTVGSCGQVHDLCLPTHFPVGPIPTQAEFILNLTADCDPLPIGPSIVGATKAIQPDAYRLLLPYNTGTGNLQCVPTPAAHDSAIELPSNATMFGRPSGCLSRVSVTLVPHPFVTLDRLTDKEGIQRARTLASVMPRAPCSIQEASVGSSDDRRVCTVASVVLPHHWPFPASADAFQLMVVQVASVTVRASVRA